VGGGSRSVKKKKLYVVALSALSGKSETGLIINIRERDILFRLRVVVVVKVVVRLVGAG
jgi:hypothetical protein